MITGPPATLVTGLRFWGVRWEILRALTLPGPQGVWGATEKQNVLDSAVDAVPALSRPCLSGARHDPQGGDKRRPYERATGSQRNTGLPQFLARRLGAAHPLSG